MLATPSRSPSIMYTGKLVFAQVMEHLPMHTFRKCVRRYGGDRYAKSFPCMSQFLCMAFAQLTCRESLRDIEVCLRAQRNKLYHMGIRGSVARNTLANANKRRDWRIHAEFAQELIRIARPLYADEDLGVELENTVFALDASMIVLTGVESKRDYPQPLRRVKYRDAKTGKTFNFLTNNFIVSPVAIADLYRHRWQVELFFKWIKKHLRIKSFYGTSENAVKTQIWIAVAVYVLVAIIKKRLGVSASLYTILQSLSITLFEKTPLFSVLSNEDSTATEQDDPNQLNMFDLFLGH